MGHEQVAVTSIGLPSRHFDQGGPWGDCCDEAHVAQQRLACYRGSLYVWLSTSRTKDNRERGPSDRCSSPYPLVQ